MRLQLSGTQSDFCFDERRYVAFVGGRGSGKSYAGAAKALVQGHLNKPVLGIVTAPTFGMLRDATWRTALQLWAPLISDINNSQLSIKCKTGAEVLFRSADDPNRLRGPNAHWAWIDEAAQCDPQTWPILLATLRGDGRMGQAWVTGTPRGFNWVWEVFVQNATEETGLYKSSSAANPFLDEDFVKVLAGQYTSDFARQELAGEFVVLGAGLFRRDWFQLVEALPAGLRQVRYWDMAATEAKEGKDPDWTVGVLMGVQDSVYYVCDVRRLRGSPRQVEATIRQTAEMDGRNVPVWMEQEPGSSGVNTIDHYMRDILPGWAFRGNRVTGSKTERANPVAAQAEAGNIRILRAPWTGTLLDELEAFPHGAHDDQVDSLSGCFAQLTTASPRVRWL